jgi:hypothetical protein
MGQGVVVPDLPPDEQSAVDDAALRGENAALLRWSSFGRARLRCVPITPS